MAGRRRTAGMRGLPLQHGIDLVEQQPPGIAVELALGGTHRVDERAGAAKHRFASGLLVSLAIGQLPRELLQRFQQQQVAVLACGELLLAHIAHVGPVVVVMTAAGKRLGRLLPHPRQRRLHERHGAIQSSADPHAPQFTDERRRPRRLGRLVAELDQPIPQHPLEPRLRMAVATPLDPCRQCPTGLRIGQRQSVGKRDGQVIGTPGSLRLGCIAWQCGHDVANQGGIRRGIGVNDFHLVEP